MREYSLSDLNRRPGELVDKALASPILLKKHGRAQLVMMSIEHFEGLTTPSPPQSKPAAPKNKLASLKALYRPESGDPDDL